MKERELKKLKAIEEFESIETKEVEGPPPVVFHFQLDSHRVYETPAALRQWERLMKEVVGLTADLTDLVGTCTESCSCCRTDDCDID